MNRMLLGVEDCRSKVVGRVKHPRPKLQLCAAVLSALTVVLLASPAAADSFLDTGSMPLARDSHTATLLLDGKLLVAGGTDGYGSNALASAVLYDPITGAWSPTGSMAKQRQAHTATLLPNGQVLVLGGASGTNTFDGVLASMELYDPVTGVWSLTDLGGAYHTAHTATLLRNGKVLIAGGWEPASALGYTQLYDPNTKTWADSGNLNVSRYGHTAILLADGRVLVIGGWDAFGHVLSSAELYNPTDGASGTWRLTGSMRTPRLGPTASLLPNGQVLVAGGIYDANTFYDTSTAELYDPASGTWTLTGSMSTARDYHTATLLPNGKVLVACGERIDASGVTYLSDTELYDPAIGTWTRSAGSGSIGAGTSTTLLANGRVLFAGGTDNNVNELSSAALYDPAHSTWATVATPSTSRAAPTATLLPNGQMLVAGGSDGTNTLASTELYDPASTNWTTTGPLNAARDSHTATLLPNGQVLVAGGSDGNSPLASAELYDLTSGTWTTTGTMNTAHDSHTATLLPNGRVLVAGGRASDGTAELYDSATGTWTITGSLNTGREFHTATLLANGKVLVAGGYSSSGYLSNAELYDPAIGTWTVTGPMQAARFNHSATLLPNGHVLVAGGNGIDPSVELYDPSNETWTATGALLTRRDAHSATLLANGRVLVAGGFGANAYIGNAELYDAASGGWIGTTAMLQPLVFHTATLLPSGQVLVIGGYNSTNGVLPSAQLYDVGAGFDPAWQPQLDPPPSPVILGTPLVLSGTGFRGVSEGNSGGAGFQASPSDHPVVQLRSIDSERTVILSSTAWSSFSFSSTPVSGLPPGWALATVFVNGIPSVSSFIKITAPIPTPIFLTNPQILANGSFQLTFANTSGALFSVLATTNLALPSNFWTVLGAPTEIFPGQFHFTDSQATNYPGRFYRISSP